MNTSPSIYIGTAGWSIPSTASADFPAEGSNLERYGRVFQAVEINSSFHRSHKVSTYQRWAAAVPDAFRFSVKVPKTITHVQRLREVDFLFDGFLGEIAGLGSKLGPLLFQLPPSLTFDAKAHTQIFSDIRARVLGPIVCEPRHASWFMPEVTDLFDFLSIGRVAADPARVPRGIFPGGWLGLKYWRMHGTPRMYYSAYNSQDIQAIVADIASGVTAGSECWCIFDNTASGAATANALEAKTAVLASAGYNS